MTIEEAKSLLERYVKEQCSAQEKRIVEAWIDKQIDSQSFVWSSEEQALLTKARIKKQLERKIGIPVKKNRLVLLRWGGGFAAAVLLVFFAIWSIRSYEPKYGQLEVAVGINKVVQPGLYSATLTMGDGSVIDLDASDSGLLLDNSVVQVNKLNDGQLVYKRSSNSSLTKVDTNEVAVPIGGNYKITLPDGTKVWLNAASKLKYPILFTTNTRMVHLEGEAYFEVSKNIKQPFIVKAGDTETLVTGTSFNLSAYKEDRRTVTTLVEGEVHVSKGSERFKLSPGQQSISTPDTKLTKREADIDAVLGWKSGYFVFDDQEIETVFRDIARWYDVDIYVDRKEIVGKRIGGAFSKKREIEELLHYLEKLKVLSFKKEGRRITVMI
ncbi:FecR family protein [Sphingobacterium tabacisoli]|uniref:FecR family protein n=1 Tax=Sphingobacterium tabacisoli TaxID=2044855 RepID=A0ABW5L641_9SPHI|nr:FecR domain-containing protein [Sphingobacterium tabacisoli]